MNAIEHGSRNDPSIPFEVVAAIEGTDLVVRVTDSGTGGPNGEPEEPDITRKLSGEQGPRGWGIFLIREMVDAVEVTTGPAGRTVNLVIHLEGAQDADRHLPG